MNPALLQIAWRNLWRNTRRTVVTISMIACAATVVLGLQAWTAGIFSQITEVMIRNQLGHAQISHAEYPGARGMHDTVPDADARVAALAQVPGVEGAAGRLHGAALAGAGDEAAGVRLLGVDPSLEKGVSNVYRTVRSGRWLGDVPAQEAVVGAALARALRVEPGSELLVVTQAADGSLGNTLLTVVGVFRSGSTALDRSGVVVHLADLQDLLVLPGQVHEITVVGDAEALAEPLSLPPFDAALVAALPGDELVVRTWAEIDPAIAEQIAAYDQVGSVMLVVVFAVAALGVLSTMLMSVYERTRELGLLLALGLKPRLVVALVVGEALFLGVASALAGLVFGGALMAWLVVHGIDFTRWLPDGLAAGGLTLGPLFHGKAEVGGVVRVVVACIAMPALAALLPAFRAARLRPVVALRGGGR